MMKKSGSILIESILAVMMVMIAVSIVTSIARLIYNLQIVEPVSSMDGYWVNLSHFLIYFPWPEPIVDIQY